VKECLAGVMWEWREYDVFQKGFVPLKFIVGFLVVLHICTQVGVIFGN
jgi:hypothetical protein